MILAQISEEGVLAAYHQELEKIAMEGYEEARFQLSVHRSCVDEMTKIAAFNNDVLGMVYRSQLHQVYLDEMEKQGFIRPMLSGVSKLRGAATSWGARFGAKLKSPFGGMASRLKNAPFMRNPMLRRAARSVKSEVPTSKDLLNNFRKSAVGAVNSTASTGIPSVPGTLNAIGAAGSTLSRRATSAVHKGQLKGLVRHRGKLQAKRPMVREALNWAGKAMQATPNVAPVMPAVKQGLNLFM